MPPGNLPLRAHRMAKLPSPPRLAKDMWMRVARPLNHRFDKLGNPLPLELLGCGCGLCARQKRASLEFFLMGSQRSQGEASDFVGNIREAR